MYEISKLNSTHNPTKQRGVATLAVGLILLFTATIITIFAAKVGLQEQRISSNEYRYKMAFEAAQAGLDYGQMYLDQGKKSRAFDSWNWQSCFTNPPAWNTSLTNDPNNPCVTGTSANDPNDRIWFMIPNNNTVQPVDTSRRYRVFFITQDQEDPTLNQPDSLKNLQVTIISEGASDIADGENAFDETTQRGYAFNRIIVETNPVAGRPDAPMIVAGTIEPTGTADIATAPNAAGGRNTPVSVWSKNLSNFSSGTPATCYTHEFYRAAQTNNPPYIYDESKSDGKGETFTFGKISNKPTEDIVLCESCVCPASGNYGLTNSANGKNIDILDNDPNFPPDLFSYLFGIPWGDRAKIKDDPDTLVLTNCSGLNKNSSGLVWVTGNCDAPANTDIGSPEKPILLVVDGLVKINANSRFFGVLYASPASTSSVTLNGGPDFYGAMIVDRNIKITSGGYSLIYHDKILTNLLNNIQRLGKIPGTWADYL